MKFKISDDKKFLILTDSTQLELEQLESSFTKMLDNWLIIKKKKPWLDGRIKFVDKYHRVPIGLWGEVQRVCNEYKFPLAIEGLTDIFAENYERFLADEELTNRML